MLTQIETPAAFQRARRATIALPQIAVQSKQAKDLLGFSIDVLHDIPFRVLPYTRIGTHRWYLVRHLELLAERVMALRIVRGEPQHLESLRTLLGDVATMETSA